MILCFDVAYGAQLVSTACVGFSEWADPICAFEQVVQSATDAAAYEPGNFYKRELPYILQAWQRVDVPVEVFVIDGYVWLGRGNPGLGARLFEAVGGRVAVVGIAKTSYRGAEDAVAVLRGQSVRPLFVTSVGIHAEAAANYVRSMHGPHRIPTFLKRADRLARFSETGNRRAGTGVQVLHELTRASR